MSDKLSPKQSRVVRRPEAMHRYQKAPRVLKESLPVEAVDEGEEGDEGEEKETEFGEETEESEEGEEKEAEFGEESEELEEGEETETGEEGEGKDEHEGRQQKGEQATPQVNDEHATCRGAMQPSMQEAPCIHPSHTLITTEPCL